MKLTSIKVKSEQLDKSGQQKKEEGDEPKQSEEEAIIVKSEPEKKSRSPKSKPKLTKKKF